MEVLSSTAALWPAHPCFASMIRNWRTTQLWMMMLLSGGEGQWGGDLCSEPATAQSRARHGSLITTMPEGLRQPTGGRHAQHLTKATQPLESLQDGCRPPAWMPWQRSCAATHAFRRRFGSAGARRQGVTTHSIGHNILEPAATSAAQETVLLPDAACERAHTRTRNDSDVPTLAMPTSAMARLRVPLS